MCLLEGAVQCRFTRIKPQMCSVMDDVVFLYHYQTKLRVMCKLDHAFGNSKLNTSYSTYTRTHTHSKPAASSRCTTSQRGCAL